MMLNKKMSVLTAVVAVIITIFAATSDARIFDVYSRDDDLLDGAAGKSMSEDCENRAYYAECDENAEYMTSNCGKECEEHYNSCRSWANGDSCRERYMKWACSMACGCKQRAYDGDCDGVKAADMKKTCSKECAGHDEDCIIWAELGNCRNEWKTYMANNCKNILCESCKQRAYDGDCDGVKAEDMMKTCSQECAGHDEDCIIWAKLGNCRNGWKTYMANNCKNVCEMNR